MILLKFLNYILTKIDKFFFASAVLTYHSVSDGRTPISVTVENFRKQMKFLKENASVVSVTFDDGYKDVFLNALPILREHNLSATIFINPSTLGGKASFATSESDRARDICSRGDLLALEAGGVTIANHGYSHRQLSDLSESEIFSEYDRAAEYIKNNFHKNSRPNLFVFPKGAKNERVKNLLISRGARILDNRVDVYSDTSMLGFVLKLHPSYLWLRKKILAARNHIGAPVLALIIGFLIAWPTVSAIRSIGPDFRGVYPMFSNDEDQYLSMTREAYDGHYNFGSVYLKEHKDAPSLMQPLAEIFFAETAKLLKISVPKLFAINDFILPFAGVLLLYLLILALAESAAVSVIFTGLYYFLFISQFNRPINPQFSFLFLFLGLLLVWRVMNNEEKDSKKVFIFNLLLAADFGIAFYIYPFVWSAIFVVYCLALAASAAKEGEYLYHLKNFLVFVIPSAIFAIPFVLNLRMAAADPNYMDANLRFGFIFNHWPGAFFNVALMVAGLAILYLAGMGGNGKREIFGWILGISGIILNWQNIITGRAFSFSMHYYWVVVLFLFLIFSICIGRKKRLATLLIIFSLLGLFYKERGDILAGLSIVSHPVDVADFRREQRLAGVAEWFDKNSPRDSAVLSFGRGYQQFIPIYTYNNDFQNANAGVFLISDDELENRWVIQNFFSARGGSALGGVNITADYIIKHDVEIWTNKFIERYQSQANRDKIISIITGRRPAEEELVPKEYVDRVLAKIDYFHKLGFEKSLKRYSVDYILLDKNDADFGYLADRFKAAPFLALEAEIGDNLIFKLK